jgi:hypothetical protein
MLKTIQTPAFVADAIVTNLTRYIAEKEKGADAVIMSAQQIMLASGHQGVMPQAFTSDLEAELRIRGFVMFPYTQALYGIVRTAPMGKWLQLSMRYWKESEQEDNDAILKLARELAPESPAIATALNEMKGNAITDIINREDPIDKIIGDPRMSTVERLDAMALRVRTHLEANPGVPIVVIVQSKVDAFELRARVCTDDLLSWQITPSTTSDARTEALGQLVLGRAGLYFITRNMVMAGGLKVETHGQVIVLPNVGEREHTMICHTFQGAEFYFTEEEPISRACIHNAFGEYSSWRPSSLTALTSLVLECATYASRASMPLEVRDALSRIQTRGLKNIAQHPREWSFVVIVITWLRKLPNMGITNKDRLVLLSAAEEMTRLIHEENQ